MKRNTIIMLAALVFCGALFIRCREEAPLTPSDIKSMSRFEFPEGDTETDRIFSEIYDRFGIQIIYKNWTQKDWQKSWTNTTASMGLVYDGFKFESGPEVDTLRLAAEFMRDHIFAHLNPENTNKIFPQYIYLVSSFCYKIPIPGMGFLVSCDVSMDKQGIDFIICSPYTTSDRYPGMFMLSDPYNGILDATPEEILSTKGTFLWRNYFSEGLHGKKIFAYPENFMPEVDYTRDVNITSPDDPDYYLTRGLIDIVNSSFNDVYTPDANSTLNGPNWLFECYLTAAIYYSEEGFKQLYGAYPAVMNGYKYVVDYMKDNYDINLKEFSTQTNDIP